MKGAKNRHKTKKEVRRYRPRPGHGVIHSPSITTLKLDFDLEELNQSREKPPWMEEREKQEDSKRQYNLELNNLNQFMGFFKIVLKQAYGQAVGGHTDRQHFEIAMNRLKAEFSELISILERVEQLTLLDKREVEMRDARHLKIIHKLKERFPQNQTKGGEKNGIY